jgi:hypothetical protein
MLERRRHHRGRVYYGGRIAFNKRSSTIDCIVRNFSDGGARVQMCSSMVLAGTVDLVIERKGTAYLSQMVWRHGNDAGFAFTQPRQMREAMSLEWALRLDASERANRSLRRMVDQLRSEF